MTDDIPTADTLRLHLGELTANEVRVAQAAIRFDRGQRSEAAAQARHAALVDLWEEFEASGKPIGLLHGDVEEYDIDAMKEAAWEIHQYALRTLAQTEDPDRSGTMTDYYGHKTMADGTHVPLTKEEAADLWRQMEEGKADLAAAMPTTQDALRMVNKATQRLRDLGWVHGGGFGVKEGDECAICEFGSTGIWSGRLNNDEEFFLYGGYVSARHNVWAKPLANLTDDERKHMEECDRESAEYMEGEFDRWSAEDDEQ